MTSQSTVYPLEKALHKLQLLLLLLLSKEGAITDYSIGSNKIKCSARILVQVFLLVLNLIKSYENVFINSEPDIDHIPSNHWMVHNLVIIRNNK